MNNFRLVFFVIMFPVLLHAQSSIGRWKSYLSFNQATFVEVAENKIYCATSGGAFYYNLSDQTINKFSREDGLSDTEISVLKYSHQNKRLIIAYKSSNIDLVTDNRIVNFNDIVRYQVLGDKSIYNIAFRDKLAYLSTGFGIIVFDVVAGEFKDTYDKIGAGGTRIKVNEVAFSGNYLFAATDEGIYRADINSPNLKDYHYWERMINVPGYEGVFTCILSRGNKIYTLRKGNAGSSDIIYVWDNTAWQIYNKFTETVCRKIIARGDTMILIKQNSLDAFDANDNMIRNNIFTGDPWHATFDNQGVFWIADRGQGMVKNPNEWDLETVVPAGPASVNVTGIKARNGKIFSVPGGPRSDLNNQYRLAEVYRYDNNRWYNWKGSGLHDFYKVIIDPQDDDHYFVGSWGAGLFEFKAGELVTRYTETNSTLQSAVPGAPFIRIGGLTFDADHNLWMTNSEVSHPVSVMTREGDWTGFPVNSYINNSKIGNIISTRDGHKWIQIISGTKGLFVMDDNGTLNDYSDDRYKRISVTDKNNAIISNDILAMEEDRDGTIWLGSSKGVILYYSPGRIFTDDNFYAQQIVVPRNDGSGTGDLLLGSEAVTAVAVDGANRKWLGTRNAGVFLVSPDGMEELLSFNTSNSPLLSNTIIDLTIDEKTGEVYFGTDKGIISYKGDAISPGEYFNDVYVYPNPVRQDYRGEIIITGLVSETIVKITDISGRLVYETRSLGGQAIWDGNNFQGERVKTGVYLVFCSDKEGTMAVVTKVLVIN